MIERFFLKNSIGFEKVDLNFERGLILFSGPSGAGKSVLLDSLLGIFALKDTQAFVAEATLDGELGLERFGLEEDEPNIFRFVKNKSSRYFINDSQVSKKRMKNISKTFIDYLSLKEYKEFEDGRILEVLDEIALKKKASHKEILKEYNEIFEEFRDVENELRKIEEEEKKIDELKEFAKYEVQKIEEISPQVGEYEELLSVKKELSKKERILEAISQAEMIFEYEGKVAEALSLLDLDSAFFDDALNQLRGYFESATDRLSELDESEIENILDRLEKLSSLKQRYGSIKECLDYLKKKKEEIEHYENISYEKEELSKRYLTLKEKAIKLAKSVSDSRKKALKELNKLINSYLKSLYLDDVKISLEDKELDESGKDKVVLDFWGVSLDKISTGEFNRVRLSFLSSFNDILNKKSDSVLVLDEVDANLSGKESMSIAKVLKKLSKNYQIFAISHQPQLTSKADMHFLVYKKSGKSFVKELKTKDEKIDELARMISGEKVAQEAMEFAKSLMEER
ncbi:MAG: AAA family ATPase [Epsilonproteobacteria bacterium]|nr:AAA family ATPase [Campylobacterota bacterium]